MAPLPSAMPLSASSRFALSFLSRASPDAPKHLRGLGELDVRVLDDLEPIAPWVEEIEERAFNHARAGRLSEFDDARAIVDDEANVAAFDVLPGWARRQRQVDELVTHIDKGVALTPATQGEREKSSVPFERRINVADFDCNMIDSDQPWFAAFSHVSLLLRSNLDDILRKDHVFLPNHRGIVR